MLKLFLYTYFLRFVYAKTKFCGYACGDQFTACKNHICVTNPSCGIGGRAINMDYDHRTSITAIHNKYRNDLALGLDKRGGNSEAADMHILSYDIYIEFIAQCWANACAEPPGFYGCNNTKDLPNFGQNEFIASSTDVNLGDSFNMPWIEYAVKHWYDEITTSTAANINKLAKGGNFTQLIWAKTTHFGCASTLANVGSKQLMYIYCNYGPTGNNKNAPVYKRGKPCSACGSDSCNSEYPGLCGKSKMISRSRAISEIATSTSQIFLNTNLIVIVIFVILRERFNLYKIAIIV